MIIAVDFDGTIVRDAYPSIGGEIPGALPALKDFQRRGHSIILWTCREGDALTEALLWLKERSFTPDGINGHLPSQLALWGTNPRKVAADVYIDDRNAPTGIDWTKLRNIIMEKE